MQGTKNETVLPDGRYTYGFLYLGYQSTARKLVYIIVVQHLTVCR